MATKKIYAHSDYHQVLAYLPDWFHLGISTCWCGIWSLHGNSKRVWGGGEQQTVLLPNPEEHNEWSKTILLHQGPTLKGRIIVSWFWTEHSWWLHILERYNNLHDVCERWHLHGSIKSRYYDIYHESGNNFKPYGWCWYIWLSWHQRNQTSTWPYLTNAATYHWHPLSRTYILPPRQNQKIFQQSPQQYYRETWRVVGLKSTGISDLLLVNSTSWKGQQYWT